MKFEGSGSKGTCVIERKQFLCQTKCDRRTDGRTDRRTDGQGKNNMSPPEGGRHNNKTFYVAPCVNSRQMCQSTPPNYT